MNIFCKALCASCLAILPLAPAFADTIVFGDSSVEQGNLYALPGHARPGTPYYTKEGFSRESNGPVWIEYLVPTITPERGAASNARDINFAYSGASSGEGNIASDSRTGLTGQVDAWLARLAAGRQTPTASDRFIIAAGVNDFIRDLGARDLRETSAEVIANLSFNAERLSRAGSQTILVEDMPSFIAAPAFKDIVPPADRPALDEIMSGLRDEHNAAQLSALAKLNAALPNTNIVTVKVSKLFEHIRANASALGFSNIDSACYDAETGALCNTSTAEQNRFLFFDNLHVTTRAQAIQAAYYGALLGQLEGEANRVPAVIARDIGDMIADEAQAERSERHRLWGANPAPQGVTIVGDMRLARDRQSQTGNMLASSSERRVYRLGVAYSDGEDWSVRLVGARIEGDSRHDSGKHELDGWGLTLAGERRWGALRLGASVGRLWGTAEGTRDIPVPLMQAQYRSKLGGRHVELEVGYDLSFGAFAFQPSAWLRYQRTSRTEYTETGDTGLEMAFDRQRTEAVVAGGALTMFWHGSDIVKPRITASFEQRVAGSEGALRGRLVDNSADAIVTRPDIGTEARVMIEPGLGLAISRSVLLDLSAHQRLGEGDRGARARLTVSF